MVHLIGNASYDFLIDYLLFLQDLLAFEFAYAFDVSVYVNYADLKEYYLKHWMIWKNWKNEMILNHFYYEIADLEMLLLLY